ncbi:hypothetical protein, partial [Caballeronia choica]|uniref:hypothetical protein n=1 Tax=Caballeronia choica TaxID=326476 RepID=UPI001F38BE69
SVNVSAPRMISWGASEGSHINALAAVHDDARYWYFSNLLMGSVALSIALRIASDLAKKWNAYAADEQNCSAGVCLSVCWDGTVTAMERGACSLRPVQA